MKFELQNISKSYGSKVALTNISCTFTEGIYGLLGPNGAGKSTLMNIIVNNLTQNSGTLILDGTDILTMGAAYRELLGFMPQQQSLFDSFTARRFLGYMGTLKGMDKLKLNTRIEEVLKMVNLTAEANKRLGSFSGGMKQRILIAQAILNDPKILILDEPTAGLDPKERIRIRNLISEISFSKIVLIATHVVPDIEFISNEILLLKQGQLIAKAKPQSMLQAIENKVYEIHTKEDELATISSKWRVGSMLKDGDTVLSRILSDAEPIEYPHNKVKPTMEDLYLYLFDERDVIDPQVLQQLKDVSDIRGC